MGNVWLFVENSVTLYIFFCALYAQSEIHKNLDITRNDFQLMRSSSLTE